MMKKTESILAAIFVVILVIVLGVVGYFASKNSGNSSANGENNPAGATSTISTDNPTSTASSTIGDSTSSSTGKGTGFSISAPAATIAGWSDYEESEIGVAMQYPPGWYIHDAIPLGGSLEFSSIPENNFMNGVLPAGAAQIMVYHSREDVGVAVQEDAIGATVASRTTTMVAGQNATEVGYVSPTGEATVVAYLAHGGYTYRITLSYHGEAQFMNLFSDFLSTFAFTR